MVRPHLYKLLGRLAVPVADALEWGHWYATADRQVARDKLDGFTVSTVFLGIDHSMGMGESGHSDDRPLLFETMVFKPNSHDETWCERCSTWDEALEQHQTVLDRVKGELAGQGDDK